MGPQANGEARLLIRVAAVALVAFSLIAVSVLAVTTARDSQQTSRHVRNSTNLWNAYQQARYVVSREWLLTHEFRLAGSPYFEERLAIAASSLSSALGTVSKTGGGNDRRIAEDVLAINAQIKNGTRRLVDAVSAGDAGRAGAIGGRLDPLFSTAQAALNRGAAAHRAESTAGLHAAERFERTVLAAAGGIFLLGVLLIGSTVAAMRFRAGLDAARRSELERLKTDALTDSLTGVSNHRAFHEQLAEALEACSDGERTLSLVMLDLDGLKQINDRYGHQMGDDQIRLLASTAAAALTAPDRIYRLGGDEFALLLASRAPEALDIVDQIHESFSTNTRRFDLGFSAGITVFEAGVTKDELARRADLALIEAKRLHQTALLYSPFLERIPTDEPESLENTGVLARALALAVDTKDVYTGSHCETVAELCALIARDLGFGEDEIAKLHLAGLLHDVGKIGVTDAILQKPGRLTEAEFETMKSHAALGARILAAADHPEEAQWVLCHHERPDGMGYPRGLKDEEIPLEAKIIAVADTFEAIVSERPYRPAKSVRHAVLEIERSAGTQFEPRCVASLARILGKGEWGRAPADIDLFRPLDPLPRGAEAA
jgi:diguanylate cyclase (GGDEF)-like protein/putative nucleotidyltransferase with HDIG domain